ncbi:nuclease-related domain-containing protein [Aquibacillus saliphilus]|uniref:nuclease-related domain-containing protein n=1 Tax=Aquibacillus saliphilus TaxID=1909422 RepID=UPI001CEFC239|nr:nuclease-related domain-containing protein [Aquibacillus saliphilus]
MGKFIGRDRLLDHIDQVSSRTNNELKGLKGEIEVGDLLANHLPGDTYIIAQPVIGKYEPDFLVISPRYGFRLIEVKNWNLNYIKSIQSNGSFSVVDKLNNPLQQVRKHADDLKGYLLSNHKYLGDPHKLIGYVNIQYGFNRIDMQKFVENWDKNNADDFFTFHMFKDELNSQLDERLARASKFRTNAIPKNKIEDIIRNIRVSNEMLSEDEINFKVKSSEIDQKTEELKQLTNQTKQMLEEQNKPANVQAVVQKEKSNSVSNVKRNIFYWILGAMVIATLVYISQDGIGKPSNSTLSTEYNLSNIKVNDQNNEKIIVQAEVIDFQYDSQNGIKYPMKLGQYQL